MNLQNPALKALNDAILDGDLIRIDQLLAADPSLVNKSMGGNITPLHSAANIPDRDMIEFLASKGADPNARDSAGKQPLYWAMHVHEDVDATQALLAAGADVNSRYVAPSPHEGKTWLHVVMMADESAVMAKLLLNHGADPMAVDNYGCTPLIFAARYGRREAMLMLLARGADPSHRPREGQLNAILEAEKAGFPALAEELMAWKHAKDAHQAIDSASVAGSQPRPLSP